MLSTILLLALVPVALGQNICYDYYNRPYYCNSGISYGARIGIGIGVAAGVLLLFLLCGYWRRRNLRNQWAKYKPPALPYHNNETTTTNPYGSNPPPPPQSNFSSNQYGSNPPPPPQTYQPSMAGQYSSTGVNTYKTGATGVGAHEHGYEWEQAREQERLEREQGNANDIPPPGYDVAAQPARPAAHYAPPPGPPPISKAI
ncbi:hypothetical protein BCR39DRAFT_538823 [Naematelia encephala]|uniref:Chitin synthesis regulation, resistance to congo red-domain-containing protein n=1 Tax=Naematelia encephala TaxID=71784 RepID=A0A1Y2AY18_9TREE|nr:hypothetical protein BCR39DRAFT_538823 [Naematelia encephala]